MIVITGATGQLGSRIVDRLLERLPAEQVGVSVRDPGQVPELAARGVRVRRGDYDVPETLPDAFEGAKHVLIVSAGSTGASAVAHHVTAIDAARAAGAERVLYTAHQAAGADSLFAPMPDHASTQDYLLEQGHPFTSLRNGFYANTVPRLIGDALESGELEAPADGAATTGRGDAHRAGPDRPRRSPAARRLEEVAALLSRGRTIRRVVVDDDEWKAGMIGRGAPAEQATLLLGLFLAARRGEFAITDPTLGELLGRLPQPFAHFLKQAV